MNDNNSPPAPQGSAPAGKEQPPTADKKPHTGGVPRKEINFTMFEALCKLSCTEAEICDVLGVHNETLNARLKEHYFDDETGEPQGFSQVYKRLSNFGMASLRREQFRSAVKKGNVLMQIWLGKQYLGQRDKFDATSAGAGIKPVQLLVNSQETINKIHSLVEKIIDSKREAGQGGAPASDAGTAAPA